MSKVFIINNKNMGKKNKEFKIYGVDLEKDYNDTKSKLISLEAKIRKRAKLVLSDEYDTKTFEELNIKHLIADIKRKDVEYVSKSKQLDMFKD